MPSKVCDISECPLLVTLYLIPREDLRSFSLKRYLLSVYSINAVIFIIPVLMMMRMWDSPGERFYHKPSDKFVFESYFTAGDWSPERTFLSRELDRAIDEEFGIYIPQYTIKHFWYVIFYSLFLSWRFWCAFSGYLTGVWASLPSEKNITCWHLLVNFPRTSFIVIGKMRCETLYGLSWWSILLVLIG